MRCLIRKTPPNKAACKTSYSLLWASVYLINSSTGGMCWVSWPKAELSTVYVLAETGGRECSATELETSVLLRTVRRSGQTPALENISIFKARSYAALTKKPPHTFIEFITLAWANYLSIDENYFNDIVLIPRLKLHSRPFIYLFISIIVLLFKKIIALMNYWKY